MKAFLRWQIRWLLRPVMSPRVPVRVQRAGLRLAGLITQDAAGVVTEPADLGGVPCLRQVPADAAGDAALLYLHGGGFLFGSRGPQPKLAAQVARACGCVTHFVDYRLAPEHPFPAAIEDCLTACRALMQQGRRIVIAGDSAGGGLALALAQRLRDEKRAAPVALVLISPWLDLSLSGESHSRRAALDPMLTREWLAFGARAYAGGRAPGDPRLSPLFGDCANLPPMLIQVGSDEILYSDSERLAQKAGATLRVYQGLWHDFQAHAGTLADADRALEEIGAFVRGHLS